MIRPHSFPQAAALLAKDDVGGQISESISRQTAAFVNKCYPSRIIPKIILFVKMPVQRRNDFNLLLFQVSQISVGSKLYP